MKKILYKIAHPILSIYWKIFKPKTFGVKLLVRNSLGEILLIRNSYVLIDHWQLPGGGFNPKKENAESAVKREFLEELGVNLNDPLEMKKDYINNSEGKSDTVHIYQVNIKSEKLPIKISSEIDEFRWFNPKEITENKIKTTRITRYAISDLG